MTGKERVLSALAHEQPDRVPVDIWAEPVVWTRLMDRLGRKSRNQVCAALQTDIRYIEPIYPEDIITNGVKENMWGERWRLADTAMGRDWQHVDGALTGARSFAEVEQFPWPNCDQVDYGTLEEQCRACDGYAVFYGNADFFERPALVRGLENFLVDTVEHPEWIDFIQQKFVDFFLEDFRRAVEVTKEGIDVYLAMTDLGSQHRLLLGPETLDRFIYPAIRTLADEVHRAGAKLMFHSCGSVREVIPQLIRQGVDILNPLQPGAAGMDPQEIKSDFGDQLCFHGGIDIQYLLPLENPEAVCAEARSRAAILGSGGGYIMAPSHNLQPDIPVENILAMYEIELRTI